MPSSNTMALNLGSNSPRRAVYEDLLDSEPGVIRQGDGWSSLSSGKAMGKPSSMASLRERALAFLRDEPGTNQVGGNKERHIVDLAQEVKEKQQRDSRGDTVRSSTANQLRPLTPGAGSMLDYGLTGKVEGQKKGRFFGKLKGLVGAGKRGSERLEGSVI
jgi:protein-serine/threonine kinase